MERYSNQNTPKNIIPTPTSQTDNFARQRDEHFRKMQLRQSRTDEIVKDLTTSDYLTASRQDFNAFMKEIEKPFQQPGPQYSQYVQQTSPNKNMSYSSLQNNSFNQPGLSHQLGYSNLPNLAQSQMIMNLNRDMPAMSNFNQSTPMNMNYPNQNSMNYPNQSNMYYPRNLKNYFGVFGDLPSKTQHQLPFQQQSFNSQQPRMGNFNYSQQMGVQGYSTAPNFLSQNQPGIAPSYIPSFQRGGAEIKYGSFASPRLKEHAHPETNYYDKLQGYRTLHSEFGATDRSKFDTIEHDKPFDQIGYSDIRRKLYQETGPKVRPKSALPERNHSPYSSAFPSNRNQNNYMAQTPKKLTQGTTRLADSPPKQRPLTPPSGLPHSYYPFKAPHEVYSKVPQYGSHMNAINQRSFMNPMQFRQTEGFSNIRGSGFSFGGPGGAFNPMNQFGQNMFNQNPMTRANIPSFHAIQQLGGIEDTISDLEESLRKYELKNYHSRMAGYPDISSSPTKPSSQKQTLSETQYISNFPKDRFREEREQINLKASIETTFQPQMERNPHFGQMRNYNQFY